MKMIMKTAPKKRNVPVSATAIEDDAPVASLPTAAEVAAEVNQVANAAKPVSAEEALQEKIPEVSVNPVKSTPQVGVIEERKKDWVRVLVQKTTSPPPTVGSFSVGMELKVTRIDASSELRLPLHVAEVLQDAGIITIVR